MALWTANRVAIVGLMSHPLGLSSDAVASLVGVGIGAVLSGAIAAGIEAWRSRQARKAEDAKLARRKQERDWDLRLALRTVLADLRESQRLTHISDYQTASHLAALPMDGWVAHKTILTEELNQNDFEIVQAAYRDLGITKAAGEADVPGRATDERQRLILLLPQAIEKLESVADARGW
jgi:hypothetical protein